MLKHFATECAYIYFVLSVASPLKNYISGININKSGGGRSIDGGRASERAAAGERRRRRRRPLLDIISGEDSNQDQVRRVCAYTIRIYKIFLQIVGSGYYGAPKSM